MASSTNSHTDGDKSSGRGLVTSRRRLLQGTGAVAVGAALGGTVAEDAWGVGSTRSPRLQIREGFPNGLVYRQCEIQAEWLDYATWESQMLPLKGIIGKALNEGRQLPNDNQRIYFTRYKQQHPEKLVILHFFGDQRRKSFRPGLFFPGHWLYSPGPSLTRPVAGSDTVLGVSDVSKFSTGGPPPLDICLVRRTPSGAVDWLNAEQMTVTAVDAAKGTATVERAQHGTSAMAFAETAYVAVHYKNRAGRKSNPPGGPKYWIYNFSTECPVDAAGRNCYQALAQDLFEIMGPGGQLSTFDGIEFDILAHQSLRAKGVDFNGDGVVDDQVVDGVNTVFAGVTDFGEILHDKLPGRIIMSDMWPNVDDPSPIAWNGVEREFWMGSRRGKHEPDWSSNINMMGFWETRPEPRPLALSWGNWKVRKGTYVPDFPKNLGRVGLASAAIMGVAFTNFVAYGENPDATMYDVLTSPVPPSPTKPFTFEVFDELVGGTLNDNNWLGRPVGPPRRLALGTPDTLHGAGKEWTAQLIGRFSGKQVRFTRTVPNGVPQLDIDSTQAVEPARLEFTVTGIPVSGGDLVIGLRLSASSLRTSPGALPRKITVHVPQSARPALGQEAWLDERAQLVTFYFRDVADGDRTVDFRVSGGEPITIYAMTAHNSADAMFRQFVHGAVFVNPAAHPSTFDMNRLLPGRTVHRLLALHPDQAPDVNNGARVGASLTIPEMDGLFVRT